MSAAIRDSQAAILVVDDNAAKRLASIAVLEPLGHAIVEAASGEAALRAVMSQTFAVILMDVRMPIMDGYETARLIRMRSQSEHTPIIFITAHASEEVTASLAYSSGAVDFIFAPVVPSVLRAKVTIFVDLFLKSHALERSAGELRDSEARTRSVLDNVADGDVTVTAAGVIESFNRAASELFGYSEHEAIGRPFATMVGATDLAEHPVESIGRRKDGSTFPIELNVSDVQLGAGTIHAAVLMDCQMPELDGYETTREIRRRELGTGRRIPIIAMTANSMQGERERCLAHGMDDYLAKPLRAQTLKDALTRWIAPTPTATPPTSPRSGTDPELLDETIIAEIETLEAEELDGILRLYYDETTAELSELSGAVHRADAIAVGKAAHRLGGSSSGIGASHISHLASELEAQAGLGDLTTADALIARLTSALGDTRAAFANRVH